MTEWLKIAGLMRPASSQWLDMVDVSRSDSQSKRAASTTQRLARQQPESQASPVLIVTARSRVGAQLEIDAMRCTIAPSQHDG
jgi:hypothetical protein